MTASVLLALCASCAKSHRKRVEPEPAGPIDVEPFDGAFDEPESIDEPEPIDDRDPTDPAPVEPEPSVLRLTECEDGRHETTCATLTEQGVALIGVDSGRYCNVPIVRGLTVNQPSGFPFALTWQGDQIYACFGGSAGKLQRISLREQTAEQSDRECMSVVSWQGGILLQNFFELWAYESFDDAAAGRHARELPFTPLALFASHGELLYGHIDGVHVDGEPVRPLETITPGAPSGQIIELEGLPNLLSQEAYVVGLDLTHDGRIVVLRTGERHGITVYDGTTHVELAHYEAPRAWIATGLVCQE